MEMRTVCRVPGLVEALRRFRGECCAEAGGIPRAVSSPEEVPVLSFCWWAGVCGRNNTQAPSSWMRN